MWALRSAIADVAVALPSFAPLPPDIASMVALVKSARRDKREPRKREKELTQEKIANTLQRYWRAQRKRIRAAVEDYTPIKSAYSDVFGKDSWLERDDVTLAELVKILTAAAKDGVALLNSKVELPIDWNLSNTEAEKWAQEYAYDMIKGIDDTTRDALRDALTQYVTTPGYTLKDFMDALPYGEQRAYSVAVTETTRAYAEGQQAAGEQLKAEFPDVAVVKIWFTNADDLVCEICAPLDGEETEIDGVLIAGDGERYQYPPAHVNCRCWMETTTRITE